MVLDFVDENYLTMNYNTTESINEALVSDLNDLIRINKDRVKGYEKAADEIANTDIELKAIFLKMANDSRGYTAQLTTEVDKLGGEPATDTTASGKLYRVWMDVKAGFTGKDRKAILELCEYGEDVAQKAYRDALSSDAEMEADIRQLITKQQTELKSSHDEIKRYRDM